MQTPEAKVKKEVKRILGKHNSYFFSPVTGGYGVSGVPDIVACIDGRFVGVECKANGRKPTKLQIKNLEDIAKRGGMAFVVDDTSVGTFALMLSLELVKTHSPGVVIDLTGGVEYGTARFRDIET
jgi:Holliday junction resolvase